MVPATAHRRRTTAFSLSRAIQRIGVNLWRTAAIRIRRSDPEALAKVSAGMASSHPAFARAPAKLLSSVPSSYLHSLLRSRAADCLSLFSVALRGSGAGPKQQDAVVTGRVPVPLTLPARQSLPRAAGSSTKTLVRPFACLTKRTKPQAPQASSLAVEGHSHELLRSSSSFPSREVDCLLSMCTCTNS